MNELLAIPRESFVASGSERPEASSVSIDWHAVAEFRLGRLVEAEHDVAKMRERMDRSLQDQREWTATAELRLQSRLNMQARNWDQDLQRLQGDLQALRAEMDQLLIQRDRAFAQRDQVVAQRDALLNSHSWQMLAPLRMLATTLRINRSGRSALLRALIRIPGARFIGGRILLPFPELRSRLIRLIVSDD